MLNFIATQRSKINITEDGENLFDTVQEYYDNLDTYKAVAKPEYGFLSKDMPDILTKGTPTSKELFRQYMDVCIPNTTHWQSPFYFSFFPSNSLPSTVVGEMAMVALNEGNSTNSEPVEKKNRDVELKILNWIADILELPEGYRIENGAKSCIYSSAGDSFLAAALAAKNKQRAENPDSNLVDKQVGYMSIVSNIAVERSIQFSNLELRYVKNTKKSEIVDEFPITAELIEEIFEKDIANGLKPTIYITTIGTTSSLCIENIKEISKACKKYNVWLHIDAAQLGIYAAVPENRFILNDIELADSFSTNGHKALGGGMGTNFFYCAHSQYNNWLSYNSSSTIDTSDYTQDDGSTYHITNPTQTNALRILVTLLTLGKEGIGKHASYKSTA